MPSFTVEVNFPRLKQLEKDLQSPQLKKFLCNEIIRHSDKYVPFSSGVLKNSAFVEPGNEAILYVAPYARYHWYGKLMVDPKTGKGAFYTPTYGFWSRPNTQKVLTNKDLNYQQAPLRGARWTERMWATEGEEIVEALEKMIGRF